jgi:hypothetical protein
MTGRSPTWTESELHGTIALRHPLVDLSGDIDPLREAFNRQADKVRVLLLVSPT